MIEFSKKLLSVVFGLLLFAFMSMSVWAFSDVSEDDLYFDAVMYLKNEGIVEGYSNGTFGYDLAINRAELLKIVVEAKFLGEPMLTAPFAVLSCFDDVPANQWYTKYICYAQAAGWVNGYSDGSFRPEQNINFVEALKIVLQVFNVTYPETSPWYRGIIETASRDNLIPLTVNSFGQIITRSEMADLIVRKIKFDAGDLEEFLGPVKEALIVGYDTIAAGIHMDEQYDPDSVLPLQINYANAGVNAITLSVSSVVLASGEQYFAECDKVSGDVGSTLPFVTSPVPELTLENLNNNTAYECYAAIKTTEGLIERQSLSLNVTTQSDPAQLQFAAAYPSVDDINNFYIFLQVVDDGLIEGYQYYFRCMKDGVNDGWQPNVATTLDSVILANLEPETDYLCYVAVYDRTTGDLFRHTEYRWYRTSDSSFAPEVVEIVDSASTATTITIDIAPIALGEGEKYFVECDKVEGYVGSIKPSITSDSTELTLSYLNNNTAYECYVGITVPSGGVGNRSETVVVTTMADSAQLQFENSSVGVDEDDGVYDYYIVLDVVTVELLPGDQYYYRCMKDGVDDREQPTMTSSGADAVSMDGLDPDTNYLCYAAILDGDGFLSRNTEYRWHTTPD